MFALSSEYLDKLKEEEVITFYEIRLIDVLVYNVVVVQLINHNEYHICFEMFASELEDEVELKKRVKEAMVENYKNYIYYNK